MVFGMLSFVGSQLTSQIDDIGSKVTDGIDQIRRWLNTTFGVTDTQLEGYIDKAREWLSSGTLTDTAASAGLTATHIVAGFFIAMFALYFFLYDGLVIWGWAVRLFPRGAREKVHSSGLIAWAQLSAFTRATLVVAAVDAAGIGIGAAILGVPFASGIALLVFFGAFIPVVGAAVSGTVAVLLALVALGPVQALIMLGIVIGVQQVEAHLLQPFLVGRVMRIHPLAVILAIAAGVILAGIIGGLIAVPTIAVINAVSHHLLDGPESEDDVPPGRAKTARRGARAGRGGPGRGRGAGRRGAHRGRRPRGHRAHRLTVRQRRAAPADECRHAADRTRSSAGRLSATAVQGPGRERSCGVRLRRPAARRTRLVALAAHHRRGVGGDRGRGDLGPLGLGLHRVGRAGHRHGVPGERDVVLVDDRHHDVVGGLGRRHRPTSAATGVDGVDCGLGRGDRLRRAWPPRRSRRPRPATAAGRRMPPGARRAGRRGRRGDRRAARDGGRGRPAGDGCARTRPRSARTPERTKRKAQTTASTAGASAHSGSSDSGDERGDDEQLGQRGEQQQPAHPTARPDPAGATGTRGAAPGGARHRRGEREPAPAGGPKRTGATASGRRRCAR